MVVCGFGIGSSLILKMKIESLLRENHILAEVFTTDVTSAGTHQADITLSSQEIKVAIEDKINSPVLVIKNFLNIKELSEKLLPEITQLQERHGLN